MTKVNCNAENCRYNKDKMCVRKEIDIYVRKPVISWSLELCDCANFESNEE